MNVAKKVDIMQTFRYVARRLYEGSEGSRIGVGVAGWSGSLYWGEPGRCCYFGRGSAEIGFCACPFHNDGTATG